MLESCEMRLAWFSPENTGRWAASGSAGSYVTESLVFYLQEDYAIDRYVPAADGAAGCCAYGDLLKNHSREPYDAFVYQIEDHPAGEAARICLALIPGIAWYHDLLIRPQGEKLLWRKHCPRIKEFLQQQNRSLIKEAALDESLPRIDALQSVVSVFSARRNLSEFQRSTRDGEAGKKSVLLALSCCLELRRGKAILPSCTDYYCFPWGGRHWNSGLTICSMPWPGCPARQNSFGLSTEKSGQEPSNCAWNSESRM